MKESSAHFPTRAKEEKRFTSTFQESERCSKQIRVLPRRKLMRAFSSA